MSDTDIDTEQDEDEGTSESTIVELLTAIFDDCLTPDLAEAIEDELETQIEHVSTFRDSGVLTRDEGLVVKLSDGSEFQITVVRSR